MASRIARPRLPQVEIPTDPQAWLETVLRPFAWRPASRSDGLRLFWRGLTAPYWLWSDIPAPQLPTLRDQAVANEGLAGSHLLKSLRAIQRRVWLQRALHVITRGAWLGLLVGCLWLVVEMAGGPVLDGRLLAGIALALFVPAVLLAGLLRPSRRQIARAMDRSFGLQERMTTAIDNLGQKVPAEGQRAEVMYLQVADAANVASVLRRDVAFALRPPIRELVLAIIAGLLFASLFFLRGGGGDIPPVQANAVPAFVPAAERFVQEAQAPTVAEQVSADAPTLEEVQQLVDASNDARRDLEELAEGLNDHALTHSVATAIDRGEYSAAAEQLRALSEQAGDLTESEREGLAQDLEQAASQMSSSDSPLAQASSQAAESLRAGGEEAENGVRQLGDAVEETSQSIASPQELDQQMQQAQASQTQQSSAGESSSEPSQSASSGEAAASNEPAGGQTAQQTGDPGAQQGGEQGSSAGADPQAGASQAGAEGGSAAMEPPDGLESSSAPGTSGQGQPTDPGDGQSPGAPSDGQASGQAQSPTDQEGNSAQEGTGAGGGGSETESGSDAPQGGAENGEGQGPSDGAPPEANVSEAEGSGEGQEGGSATDPRQAISLSRAPEGESVQVPGSTGNSSLGSGAGVTVSGGSTVQGEVGETGPDSNHVPAPYRPIVESYFSDPEDG